MAIYITGDIHGEPETRLSNRNLQRQGIQPLQADDIVMIAGDFGLPWVPGSKSEKYRLEWLETRPYTIAFVDGNHENFDILNSLSEEIWNGGRVHRICQNVFHLIRGEIYQIQGSKFFVFGGAKSIDRAYRVKGESWWPQEIYSEVEYENAIHNLTQNNYAVEYVITHTAPLWMVYDAFGEFIDEYLSGKLDCATQKMLTEIEKKMIYAKWFFGHFHFDRNMPAYCAIYTKVIKISG